MNSSPKRLVLPILLLFSFSYTVVWLSNSVTSCILEKRFQVFFLPLNFVIFVKYLSRFGQVWLQVNLDFCMYSGCLMESGSWTVVIGCDLFCGHFVFPTRVTQRTERLKWGTQKCKGVEMRVEMNGIHVVWYQVAKQIGGNW